MACEAERLTTCDMQEHPYCLSHPNAVAPQWVLLTEGRIWR